MTQHTTQDTRYDTTHNTRPTQLAMKRFIQVENIDDQRQIIKHKNKHKLHLFDK